MHGASHAQVILLITNRKILMKKIKPRDVKNGMRIRICDDDNTWVEGTADDVSTIRRGRMFRLWIDTVKPYSTDEELKADPDQYQWVDSYCECFLVD